MEEISAIDTDNLIYIDETGVDSNITVQYGWSLLGEKSYAEKDGFTKERVSIVAAYDYLKKDLIAPFEFIGHMNASLFNSWFEQVLCPVLKPGKVIILDNASFHKSIEIQDLADSQGCRVLFLPAYSPDLNPIEKFWANFKKQLRKIIKKSLNFKSAISSAMRKSLSG